MSFPKDSAFKQAEVVPQLFSGPTGQAGIGPCPVGHPGPLGPPGLKRTANDEVEAWYREADDLVRSIGSSTSTGSGRGSQKNAQKAGSSGGSSYGSFNLNELHDRLTALRDSMYGFLR